MYERPFDLKGITQLSGSPAMLQKLCLLPALPLPLLLLLLPLPTAGDFAATAPLPSPDAVTFDAKLPLPPLLLLPATAAALAAAGGREELLLSDLAAGALLAFDTPSPAAAAAPCRTKTSMYRPKSMHSALATSFLYRPQSRPSLCSSALPRTLSTSDGCAAPRAGLPCAAGPAESSEFVVACANKLHIL